MNTPADKTFHQTDNQGHIHNSEKMEVHHHHYGHNSTDPQVPVNSREVQGQPFQQEPPDNISNLLVAPKTGKLIGRDSLIEELQRLHKDIDSQESKRLAITFVHGIGGVGKTELTKEYIRQFKDFYEGGICWLEEKGEDVNSISQQIIDFAKTHLNLQPPQRPHLNERAVECWKMWQKSRKGEVLIVVDNLTEFKGEIYACLKIPIEDEHFKVLVTMPLNPSRDISSLIREEEEKDLIKEVDNLEPEHALAFLKCLISKHRVDNELKKAEELCNFLGNLPLAIELVGLYLREAKEISLETVYNDLEDTEYFEAILNSSNSSKNCEKSINAVFSLSWKWYLESASKENEGDYKLLGYLFSLFSSDTIAESLIKRVLKKLGKEDRRIKFVMDIAILPLVRSSLIQKSKTHCNETEYRLHRIVQKFLGYQLEKELPDIENIKRQFCQVMLEEAKRISATPTHDDIEVVKLSIYHIMKVAQDVKNWLKDEDEIIEIYLAVGRYYEGNGLYVQAEDWYCKYQSMNLDKGCPNFVKAQNALAYLNCLQENNSVAKDLYGEAYELGKKWFEKQGWNKEEKVEEWMSIVQSQDGLGYLHCYLISDYKDKTQRIEQFAQAKELLENALEERVNFLINTIGSEKKLELSIALSHQHLGYYYISNYLDLDFDKLDKAENHYKEALEIRQKVLEETHPLLAESKNNLGIFYFTKYVKKFPKTVREFKEEKITLLEMSIQYFREALELYKNLYGSQHIQIALIFLNLADIYVNYVKNNVDLGLDLKELKEKEKAVEILCGDVIKIGKFLSYPYLKVKAYIKLIELCCAKKAYKKAEHYYNMGFDLASSENCSDELEELEGFKEIIETN